MVDPRLRGELADEALPEEDRRGRADRTHEIDRHRQRRVDRLDQEIRQAIALIVDAVDHALIPDALRRPVEPALARGGEQRLPRDAGMDGQRIALCIDDRTKAAARVRPIDIVLHVLLARADELDRASHGLGGENGLHHEVRHDLAAEASAEKRHVDLHVLGRAASCVSDRLLARSDRLDRPPELDLAVAAVARGGVDRFERRMGDVRQHETALDYRCGAIAEEPSRSASHQRGDATLGVQGRIQHRVDLGAREIALRATVECDVQHVHRAPRLPEMIGDHADRVVARRAGDVRVLGAGILVGDGQRRQPHHGMHARHFQDIGLIPDGNHLPGK